MTDRSRDAYRAFIFNEIELYKDSLSRTELLALGDEAAAELGMPRQPMPTEVEMIEVADRIIARRLQLPSFETWRLGVE